MTGLFERCILSRNLLSIKQPKVVPVPEVRDERHRRLLRHAPDVLYQSINQSDVALGSTA
jgi:hypothetical protein